MGPPSFTEFRLRQLSFEVRFDDAYLLWDRAGHLWREVAAEFGELSADKVTPAAQVFHAQSRYALNATTTVAFAIDYQPGKRESKSPLFLAILCRVLEIEMLSRIGLRFHFIRECKDAQSANKLVRDFGLVQTPQASFFGIENQKVNPTFHIEVSDDDFGYLARVTTQTRKVNFQPSPDVIEHLEAKSVEKNDVLLDLDLYTVKPVSIELFEPASWLERWRKQAIADLPSLLGMQR